MAYLYSVETNKGTYDVTVQKHHEHISRAEFERILLQTISNLIGTAAHIGGQLALHRYTHKGQR